MDKDEKITPDQSNHWTSGSLSRFSLSIFENSPSAIIVYEVRNEGKNGEDYIIVEANETCLKTEGWDRTVIGKPLKELRPNIDEFGIVDAFYEAYQTGELVLFPAKIYKEEGRETWFENRIFRLPTGEVVSIYSDVTKAKQREMHIEYMGRHDVLTGLLNRSAFEEILNEITEIDGAKFAILIGDLDGLKMINDAFGYETGDQALKCAANILRESCRENDIICRWGGDEFVVLMPNIIEEIGWDIYRRIKEKGENTHIANMEGVNLSFSLGYAYRSLNNEKWWDTLKCAENSMYKSKMLGTKSYRNVILSSIKNTLHEKSFETEEHGERLAHYCLVIGERMGLSGEQLDELKMLGMIHDIGKIAIDDRILNKPDMLTPEEYEQMKKHPEIGFRIACTIPELAGVSEYILTHHERWDGKGYPEGISGEAIPLPARIIAVADAYDAMVSDRPYRKALLKEEAIEVLKTNAGTQFDPKVVEIFIKYLNEQ